MRKLLYMLLTTVILLTATASPLYAASLQPRLIDEADLLTDGEEADLLAGLNQLSEQHQVDIVVCTASSLGGSSATEYTDDLFETHFYGMGSDRSCILLMVCTESSDWHITTAGYGITALTDVGITYIGDQIVPMMSNGQFADAFREYASLCDTFIDMARKGDPFDKDNLPKEPFPAIRNLILSLAVGIVAGWILTGRHKAKLTSVTRQLAAKNYTRENSLKVTESREFFLYKTVTRREKNDDKDSSSTHTTKSGTKVGGGGGKF